MVNKGEIYTIGYQEKSLDDFLSCITDNKINVVIDIRYNPNSRRKGFSKNKLASHLQEKNIKYYHYKDLGTPPLIRKKAIEKKDHMIVINKWKATIDKKLELLKDLKNHFIDDIICFMCYEKDATHCHRSVVVQTYGALTRTKIIHL